MWGGWGILSAVLPEMLTMFCCRIPSQEPRLEEALPWMGPVVEKDGCRYQVVCFNLVLSVLSTGIGACFPGGSGGEESACNAGDLDSVPG